ncbi:MAG: c-type cytochrome, partial [Planctomycetota bacterium]
MPELARLRDLPAELREPLAIVAEHAARRSTAEQLDLNALISGLNQAQPEVAAIVVRGLVAGWPDRSAVPLTPELEEGLAKLVERLPLAERSPVLQLADHWGSRKLEGYAQEITAGLLKEFDDENKSAEERLAAAERLVDFRPGSVETASALLERITPQMEPGLATGIVKSMAKMQADEVGPQLAANILNWPPSVQRTAVEILLGRRGWTGAAMELLEQGQLQITDLSLEQRTNLQNHPNEEIRKRAMELLARGGALPNADRQAVLTEYEVATHSSGNATAGKQVFLNVCAKCHKHSGEGQQIGPELTGMAVHPKEELLVHILDPSRSVETNYRMFQVQTIDGLTLAGMLGGESKTAIELIDSQGQRKSVLREEIEEMKGSRLSVMPEGIEKEITVAQMTDLLEFLTQRGTWLPLDVAKVATVASDRGMFYSREAEAERLVFPEWK